MNKTLHLVSLGCTKNLVDSEVMLGKLSKYKITNEAQNADVIIINTCGFIQSAKEESINTILNLHAIRKKGSTLVVSGCLTQRYQEELQKDLPEIDIFTGVGDYDKIDQLIKNKKNQFSSKVFLANNVEQRIITGSSYHAYIKLSEGCNQTCSFCAIPSFKGKLSSRTLQSITQEINNLCKKGYYDFTFISQDSSSFLKDKSINNGLELLIDQIEQIKAVKSARILYLYPSTTTIKLIDKIGQSKIFHSYFDMPLQHISQNVLKIMKRGKDSSKLKEMMNHMKKYDDAFIRTTFIVGHPGETLNDFEQLCQYVKEYNFSRVNVFSYSDEEGTKSHSLPNKVEQNIIDQRADILGDIISKTTIENLKEQVGKEVCVVVDSISQEHEYLLSAKNIIWAPQIDGEIYINNNELKNNSSIKFGKIYNAKITDIAGDNLLATIF